VALCDDNRSAVEWYAQLISHIAEEHRLEITLSCFYSGEELLFHCIDAPEQMDIIYLDILMEKTDGMETARALRDYLCTAQIVFLTSCEDYVYEAFDVDAIQYLLKEDTNANKFEQVFLRAAARAAKKQEELFKFDFGGKTTAIPIQQISYFEIWKRLVTVHYDTDKTAKFYGSMEQLEQQFSGRGFVRPHRSYLVQLSYITSIHSQELELKTGKMIPLGVTYAQSLKRKFSDYITRLHIYHSEYWDDKEEAP
jgi:DNA-binding LytR/AlgR family response regulator